MPLEMIIRTTSACRLSPWWHTYVVFGALPSISFWRAGTLRASAFTLWNPGPTKFSYKYVAPAQEIHTY